MGDELGIAKEVLKQLPIEDVYTDALQPAAKVVGKSLETVAKAINSLLAPVRGFVWGWERVEGFLRDTVAKKMAAVPEEHWVTPSPRVAVPALESLRYCGSAPFLADMYASLLATAMDLRSATTAHPAFVEIIRQMLPDEARIVRLFRKQEEFPVLTIYTPPEYGDSGGQIGFHFGLLGYDAQCEHPELTPAYIDNIRRLGLAEFPLPKFLASYKKSQQHSRIEELPEFCAKKAYLCEQGKRVTVVHEVLIVNQLGRQFVNACVVDPLSS